MAKRAKTKSRRAPAVPKVAVAPASAEGPNRKIRKEEARRQREALQRKIARRRYYRIGVAAVIVLAAAGAIAFAALGKHHHPAKGPVSSGIDPATLAGIQRTVAPWAPEYQNLAARLKAMKFPILTKEATVYHIHQDLRIFIHGKEQPVPVCIGIYAPGNSSCPDEQSQPQASPFLTVLHTHDGTGIIHVESPVKKVYTLGDAFDVWGVYFTKTCVGVYCNTATDTLQVFLNGKAYTGDPTKLPLLQHELIVVTYGKPSELPKRIPKKYSGSLSPTCAPGC